MMNRELEYRNYFWQKIEMALDTCVPAYVKNAINYSGYENPMSLKQIDASKINNIQNFVRSPIYKKVVKGNAEDFFGIFYADDPESFEFSDGDIVLILGTANLLRNDTKLFNTKKRHNIIDSGSCNSGQSEAPSADEPVSQYDENREKSYIRAKIFTWTQKKKNILPSEILKNFNAIEIKINLRRKEDSNFMIASIKCPESGCESVTRFQKRKKSSQPDQLEWSISNFVRHLSNHYEHSDCPSRKRCRRNEKNSNVDSGENSDYSEDDEASGSSSNDDSDH